MAYYEDWDDEEEFFANSPVDEAMNAFTKAIMDNVKKSILDELERAGIQEGDTVKMYGLAFEYFR